MQVLKKETTTKYAKSAKMGEGNELLDALMFTTLNLFRVFRSFRLRRRFPFIAALPICIISGE